MIIARYERSIRSLHGAALAVNRRPSDYAAALELQLSVLRKLKYLERRIHTQKEHRRQLRSQLKGKRTAPLSKEAASRLKARIRQCEHAQREYQFLADLVKTFCDAVAFTYLDKWDIKPLAFRPSPGHLSGKVGLQFELRVLRSLLRKGQAAILNDLTHCLRYGDITIASPTGPMPIELKSGKGEGSRGRAQAARIQHVRDYFNTDHTNSLYGLEGEFVRFDAESREVNYLKKISVLLKRALATGDATTTPESGLVYAVHVTDKGRDAQGFTELLSRRTKHFVGKPLLLLLNEDKLGNSAYLPRPLAIRDETAFWRYLCGEIQIFVVMDTGYVEALLKRSGLKCSWILSRDHMFEIWPEEVAPERGRLIVSSPFFLRVAYEFLSLEWFLRTITIQQSRMRELLDE
jgi:hypothetical protein